MDEFREILRAIIEQSQELVDEFSEEETAAIAQFITRSLEFLQRQQAVPVPPETAINAPPQQPPGAPPQQPELPLAPHESSNINGFLYNPNTQELKVQFHGPYPNAAGAIYSYAKVPEFIYNIFSQGAIGPKTSGQNRYHRWIRGVTPSHGGALNALLKAGGFAYQRLS